MILCSDLPVMKKNILNNLKWLGINVQKTMGFNTRYMIE